MNQYIVYALTWQTTSSYTISIIPEAEVKQQQQEFQLSILQGEATANEKLGKASTEEIELVLSKRERVELEPELSGAVVAHLHERIRLSKLAR